ncbi:MAG: hypothetical protein PHO46_10205, partial [Thermoguttaceae bacterium]|nr:hypothetical protein [Thermoguttaceae bacterium]
MSRAVFIWFVVLILLAPCAFGKICPRCGRDHLPNDPPAPKVEPLAVTRERFYAPSIEIADEADRILDRLEERYGKPKVWKPFPIYFKRYTGNGVAGYTLYSQPVVKEVVVFEPFANSVGATLDHELTHAFFFYFLNSNFDLFLNEG